jgi:hypothetical protein
MSIVACVKTYGGVVLGADSMSTISSTPVQGGPPAVLKTYGHAEKVFRVGNLPIGVATYGIGNIGPRSIGSHLIEFSGQCDKSLKVEEVAVKLLKFLGDPYADAFGKSPPEQRPVLGIYVAGYNPKGPYAEEWEFIIPKDEKPRQVRPANQFGSAWRGMDLIFTRLFFGFDPRVAQDLTPEVYAKMTSKYVLPVVFDPMPVQDAIDFTRFILTTTVNMSRFMVGSPVCGGALDIAAITEAGPNEERFVWVSHKRPYVDRRSG